MSGREIRRARARADRREERLELLWQRWVRRPLAAIRYRRRGERVIGAFAAGASQLGARPWRDDVYAPEGHRFRVKRRRVPALPGKTLYDGTRIRAQRAKTIELKQLVPEHSDLAPPTGRNWPRGMAGWRVAFMLLLLFPVFLSFAAFDPSDTAQDLLTQLPFVDATDPVWKLKGDGSSATAATERANFQAMVTANPANTFYFGATKRYCVDKPILFTDGCWFVGAGTNRRQTISGTTFLIATGANAADWAGQGYFTSLVFANDTHITGLGEVTGFRDFLIDCNGNSYGNGIQCAGVAQPHFINLRWENYLGTEGMPQRGVNVGAGTKAFGQGFGFALTSYTINGHNATSVGSGANDPLFLNCRQTPKTVGPDNNTGTFSSSPLIWTDDDGNTSITDGCIIWCQPEGGSSRAGTPIQTQAGVNQGIVDIQHAGGWHIDFLHLNGPGGHGLRIANCMSTHLTNSWMDGWGSHGSTGAPGDTWFSVQATMAAGGAAGNTGLSMWGNTWRFRDEQQQAGNTYTLLNFNGNGTAGCSLLFNGNNGWVQSAATTGTLNLFTFQRGGAGATLANISGNTFLNESNAYLEDARIFDTSVNNTWVTIRGGNNSWDYGSAIPTTGTWYVGAVKRHPTPAAGSPLYFVCVAAGSPGTWVPMTLAYHQDVYVNVPGDFSMNNNPAAAVAVTGLVITIGANEVWVVDCYLPGVMTGTGGHQWSWTGPAGATNVRMSYSGNNTSITNYRTNTTNGYGSSSTFGTYTAGGGFIDEIHGIIENGNTAGTLQLNVANVTNGDTVVVNRGARIQARRIA